MSDLQRDIGGLEARMDEHEKRFARVEEKIDAGFAEVKGQLSRLVAADNRRKGAAGVIKLLIGGGILTGLAEAARAWLSK
jgi:hypothetical protein